MKSEREQFEGFFTEHGVSFEKVIINNIHNIFIKTELRLEDSTISFVFDRMGDYMGISCLKCGFKARKMYLENF